MVMAVTTVMEGEAAEWVAALYGDHSPELRNVGLFLSAVQERFKDNTQALQAGGELLRLKQRGRPVKEYIRVQTTSRNSEGMA